MNIARKKIHKKDFPVKKIFSSGFSSELLWLAIQETFDGKWSVFAKKANLSPSAVLNWLRGTAEPKIKNLQKICQLTGKKAEDFYVDFAPETEDMGEFIKEDHAIYYALDLEKIEPRLADYKKCMQMVKAILESRFLAISEAFKGQIHHFYELLKQKEECLDQRKRVLELEKKIEDLLRKNRKE